jgi:hypothetical protein
MMDQFVIPAGVHRNESLEETTMQKSAFYLVVSGLALGLASSAQGAPIYAYAQQTLSGVTVAGTFNNPALTGLATSAASAINGSGVSNNNATDTLEAYSGAAPPAPQNSYVKYSTLGGGPQAGDFTRGDAVLSNLANVFTTGFTASTVAESATSGPNGLLTGTSSWLFSGTFTSPNTANITVSYNFANDIMTVATTPGAAQAKFSFLITVKDTHGHSVDSSPAELNSSFSAPPNGPEVITSGSGSTVLSLAGLTAGDVYAITFTGESASDVTSPSAVPEPNSAVLFSCGAGLLLLRKLIARRTQSRLL